MPEDWNECEARSPGLSGHSAQACQSVCVHCMRRSGKEKVLCLKLKCNV